MELKGGSSSKMPSQMTDSRAARQITGFIAPTSGAHAVLFYGAEGSPLRELAQMLANGWICSSPSDGWPCGQCRSCVALQRGSHVDLKRISPQGPSSLIKINSITLRENPRDGEPEQPLQEFFRTPPLMGRHKVVIIEAADRMNGSAANSLLKILEEPNPYAKLILTTNALSDLLPTILSRCVNVPAELCSDSAAKGPAYQIIDELAVSITRNSCGGALRAAEGLKSAWDKIEAGEGLGARAAQARALAAFSRALLLHHPERPEWAQRAIEAHRRLVGNGNASLITDSLFTSMMSEADSAT